MSPTPDLRESVARRLRAAWQNAAPPSDMAPWENLGPMIRGGWLDAADECLRLMEWARFSDRGEALHLPLTLPPDDWRPTPL